MRRNNACTINKLKAYRQSSFVFDMAGNIKTEGYLCTRSEHCEDLEQADTCFRCRASLEEQNSHCPRCGYCKTCDG